MLGIGPAEAIILLIAAFLLSWLIWVFLIRSPRKRDHRKNENRQGSSS